jgi:Glycosyl transferase family 2
MDQASSVGPSGVRIHGLCLVKNAADVIAQSLTAAAGWCDAIYVWDNGSTDGTWEKVQALAGEHPQIVPDRQDPQPFRKTLRRELFEAHRHDACDGDWWCLLDADEFYIDDPKTFLAGVRRDYDEVWAASFEYYFTERDAARYAEDPSRYGDDVPVERKLRFYLNNWSEPRFFRFRTGLLWRTGAWPEDLGPPSPRRIRLKHFQYRSPRQIETRLATRLEAIGRGHFAHEGLPAWKGAVSTVGHADFSASAPENAGRSWEERVVDSSLLIEDTGDGDYVIDEASLPSIPPARPAWVRWLRRRARPLKRLW